MIKNIQSALLENNNMIRSNEGVWSADNTTNVSYSDGAASESSLTSILRKAKDRSALSMELENSSYDWTSEYHLSSDRANLYRFLDLSLIETGLELGSGCGAITRYLGEQNIALDAVEGSIKRAQICRLRCEDLKNVEVFQANFNHLTLPSNTYDAIFLNGVLEYAKRFHESAENDRDALLSILKRCFDTLNEDGVVCVAIENRMGLKYWLGAREDHFASPFVGLYGYPNDKGIRTYDQKEWRNILAELGQEYSYRFIYPFPDYKMAKAILTDEYVQNNPYAHSHLYRLLSSDNGKTVQSSLNEFLLWESLQQRGDFGQYANSFFILISKSEKKLSALCPYDFMHVSGKGRKPHYRTITQKKKEANEVEKLPTMVGSQENEVLHHDLSPAQHVKGPLLVSQWLHALVSEDSTVFERCVREYYQFLLTYFKDEGNLAKGVDILPFNIVITEDGSWEIIDKEWVVNFSYSPEFLLFRALFWFPSCNESLLAKLLGRHSLFTLKEFIEHYFNMLSLSLEDSLHDFITLEELLQSQISNQIRSNPVENSLVQPLRHGEVSTESNAFLTQLYWTEEQQPWTEDKSIFEPGRLGLESQNITFKLPPSSTIDRVLRFDPADRAGFFRVQNITITPSTSSGELENSPWHCEGVDSLAEIAELNNIEYCKNGLGELFISTGNDPHFILELPQHVHEWMQEDGIIFSATLDWPKSADYLVVMDSLGKTVVQQQAELHRLAPMEDHNRVQADKISLQAAQLKETSDQVRSKDIYIKTIEAEIEAMRNTFVWRTAEQLRKNIYYRLLDGRTLAQKSIGTLKKEGFRQFLRKIKQHLSSQPDSATLGLNRNDYDLWCEHNQLTPYDLEEMRNQIKEFDLQPKISIVVPVYNVDQEWLERTIDSVRGQIYENWELCLCDDLSPKPHIRMVLNQYAELDSRIKVKFKEVNEGIALTSNAALNLATGEYVGLLDHDDEITPDALFENVKVINTSPEVGLIYSDEDKLDMQGRRCDPFFKPDFSPELLRSQNYICHFTVIKKSILDELGGFRKGYDGSQDHDLILRAVEMAESVHHIPKILYHWRKIPGSTAAVYDSKSYAWEAGRKAVEDSLQRTGIKGEATFAKYQGSYRARPTISGNPLVSIIIPFKDKSELLQTAIESILAKTTYQNYEILGISNNSNEPKTQALMKELAQRDNRVSFTEYNVPFNFSKINNHAVEIAKGDYIVLLNNDIEIISPEWIDALLEFAQLPDIGAVGGKLYYDDNRIQHAGIVLGMAGVAGHPHHLFHKDDVGYYARTHIVHNVSALTGACLMVRKDLYKSVGGMDTENFGVAYNDVDFCLKLLQRGYRNVFTPYCEMFHYESQSRGYDNTPEKMQRLEKESAAFNKKWKAYFDQGDPYHNQHLSLEKTNYSIKIHQ